jgi:Alpha-glutamyl/putrescinyl thymine pyrophosphorylase clade 3
MRKKFVGKLLESCIRLRALRMKKFVGSLNPQKKGFHPFLTITEKFGNSEHDEAVWLAFICTHFGWESNSPRTRDTVRLFYGRFGDGLWDWEAVSKDPEGVREWMLDNPSKVRRLKFSNHRKYETNNPRSRVGTAAVIGSFVAWVREHGNGSPYNALRAVLREDQTKETNFESLYKQLKILRFGRTAKFDFLSLLGNLGILPISPGHSYLRGATGPRAGAILMVTGKRHGRLTHEVERTIRALQKRLALPVECLEDALCNWQKSKDRGFLSTTCG